MMEGMKVVYLLLALLPHNLEGVPAHTIITLSAYNDMMGCMEAVQRAMQQKKPELPKGTLLMCQSYTPGEHA